MGSLLEITLAKAADTTCIVGTFEHRPDAQHLLAFSPGAVAEAYFNRWTKYLQSHHCHPSLIPTFDVFIEKLNRRLEAAQLLGVGVLLLPPPRSHILYGLRYKRSKRRIVLSNPKWGQEPIWEDEIASSKQISLSTPQQR